MSVVGAIEAKWPHSVVYFEVDLIFKQFDSRPNLESGRFVCRVTVVCTPRYLTPSLGDRRLRRQPLPSRQAHAYSNLGVASESGP